MYLYPLQHCPFSQEGQPTTLGSGVQQMASAVVFGTTRLSTRSAIVVIIRISHSPPFASIRVTRHPVRQREGSGSLVSDQRRRGQHSRLVTGGKHCAVGVEQAERREAGHSERLVHQVVGVRLHADL